MSVTTVYLRQDQVDRLVAMSKLFNVSRARLIRGGVDRMLARLEKAAHARRLAAQLRHCGLCAYHSKPAALCIAPEGGGSVVELTYTCGLWRATAPAL